MVVRDQLSRNCYLASQVSLKTHDDVQLHACYDALLRSLCSAAAALQPQARSRNPDCTEAAPSFQKPLSKEYTLHCNRKHYVGQFLNSRLLEALADIAGPNGGPHRGRLSWRFPGLHRLVLSAGAANSAYQNLPGYLYKFGSDYLGSTSAPRDSRKLPPGKPSSPQS